MTPFNQDSTLSPTLATGLTLQDKTNDENDDEDNGDDEEEDHDEEMDIEDGMSLNFLEKSLQNLLIDIEQDNDTYINSPLPKKKQNVLHH